MTRLLTEVKNREEDCLQGKMTGIMMEFSKGRFASAQKDSRARLC